MGETSEVEKKTASLDHHIRKRRKSSKSSLKRAQRRFLKLVRWRLVFITLILVLVFGGGFQVLVISNAVNRLTSSFQELERTIDVISNKTGTDLTLSDFQRLQFSVRQVSDNIEQLQAGIQPIRGLLAILSRDWLTTMDLLDVSQELLTATTNMLIGVEPALFYMVDGQQDETVVSRLTSGERIVELMELGHVRFSRADTHLRQARTILDNIKLSGISQGTLLQVHQIENYYEWISEINIVFLAMPDLLTHLLGLEQTQTYLVLAQNSDELRPSGGYISTYGWITVRNGQVIDYDYFPTTTETPDPPPADIATTVSVPDWWIQYDQPIYAMWDGSWYASFPHTAEMARQYYDLGEDNPNRPIDGVIAIDIHGFELILEALESVGVNRSVDGQNQLVTVTSNNFRQLVYDVRAADGGINPHKEFIADIYNAIFSKWQTTSTNPDFSQNLFGVLLESLQQKHIMFYSTNDDVNEVLNILGWNGHQTPAVDHDYLMVVDANLGNKSNRSIIRQLTYDVTINTDETLSGRLTVSYEYPDTIARNDPAINPKFHGPIDYNNLIQIFVPKSAVLISQNNFGTQPQTIDDEHHTIFIARGRVEYDTSQRFQLSYTLPSLIENVGSYHHYRLLLQKQPGIQAENVNVQVSLPLGSHLISTSPEPSAIFDIDNYILDFHITLSADRWLEITYEPADNS